MYKNTSSGQRCARSVALITQTVCSNAYLHDKIKYNLPLEYRYGLRRAWGVPSLKGAVKKMRERQEWQLTFSGSVFAIQNWQLGEDTHLAERCEYRKAPDSWHIHVLVPNVSQPLTMTRLRRHDCDAHKLWAGWEVPPAKVSTYACVRRLEVLTAWTMIFRLQICA